MNKTNNEYKPVIGLEVHIELATKSKMFCGCPADHFGKVPNTQTCPVCLGLPGALPVANKKAIDWCLMLGLSLGCKINKFSNFDRKHYFYPDLPKAYQISQYDDPFAYDGKFQIPNSKLQIRIRRVHMEEDTAKLQHSEIDGKKISLIDFNRSGVALVELVTEPDFSDVDSVVTFGQELQKIARYLGISTADMEKGSMRLEANISLQELKTERPKELQLPNYKVELKNINSFRFMRKAILYEIERQKDLLMQGITPVQETRGWSESKSATFTQRVKEEAKDYRYFPDPDIPPIEVSEYQVSSIKKNLPELPQARKERFIKEYGISDDMAEILTTDKKRADYFEEVCKLNNNYKLIANLMVNKNMDQEFEEAAGLAKKLHELSNTNYESGENTQIAIENVLTNNPEIIKKYQSGQTQVVGFLIGQVQKDLKGKGDPKKINQLLIEKLNG